MVKSQSIDNFSKFSFNSGKNDKFYKRVETFSLKELHDPMSTEFIDATRVTRQKFMNFFI